MTAVSVPPAIDRPPVGSEDLILTGRVTENHVRLGKPESCLLCPWALAIVAACQRIGLARDAGAPVVVLNDHASLRLADQSVYVADFPPWVNRWIHQFDRGKLDQVEPTDFSLVFRRSAEPLASYACVQDED